METEKIKPIMLLLKPFPRAVSLFCYWLLWFMMGKIFTGSIYSGLSLCHHTLLGSSGMSPRAGTAPGLETQQKERGVGVQQAPHGIQRKGGKGTSWEQLCWGREGRWSTHSSLQPSALISFLPQARLFQACLFQLISHRNLDLTPVSLHLLSVPCWKGPGSLPNLRHWEATVSTEPPPALPCSAVPL